MEFVTSPYVSPNGNMKIKDRHTQIRLVIIGVGTLLLVLCLVLVFTLFMKPKATDAYLNCKDNISTLNVMRSNSTKMVWDNKNYKIVVFLSDGSDNCLSNLPILKEIREIYCKNQGIELMLLWENKIPEKETKKYDLYDNSYSLGNVRISPSLNTIFIVDQNNNVVFVDSKGYKNAISFLSKKNLTNKEKLISNANDFIVHNIVKNSTGLQNLIYFSMPGCKDCKEATPKIYTPEITKKFNITRIERDKNAAKGDIVDKLSIFKDVYDIHWYPSFLIIHSNGKWDMVRKIDVQQLQHAILSYAD